jgi:hypothetical protein
VTPVFWLLLALFAVRVVAAPHPRADGEDRPVAPQTPRGTMISEPMTLLTDYICGFRKTPAL